MTDDRRPARPNPLVRGERVYLRAMEPADAELVHDWYAHADTARLMGEWPRSLARRRADAEAAISEAGRDWFAFIVCLIADDRPVGRIDVFEVDRHNGSAAFGLAIGEHDLRGRGLGTDAVNAVLDFCFGQLRLERVWLVTDSVNLVAQHVYEKAGLVHEGRLRKAFYQDGTWQDDIRMAILRSDWEALPRKRSWDYTER
ncbi:MAG TPA: GNAT family protein [Candidatus Limnocylindrales bacterium]|nr:GNAT family protein [Candidatus Limnocylindrales bacterium]